MKKRTITIASSIVLGATLTKAGLLIGWDGGTVGNSATNAPGVSGSLFAASIYEVDTAAGSTDGTFGSSIPGADTATTAYAVRLYNSPNNDRIGVQIYNQTGSDIQLDSLEFDYGRWWADSPQDVVVTYAYGALDDPNNTAITTVTGAPALGGKAGDYTDFSVSLSGLTDTVLANGERATFNLIASNAANIQTNGAFDNVAVVGTVIPEPATLGLLAMISTGLFGIRRILM